MCTDYYFSKSLLITQLLIASWAECFLEINYWLQIFIYLFYLTCSNHYTHIV